MNGEVRLIPQLTLSEGSRLAELEAVVERGFQTFIDVGQALQEIRDGRLYRATHATFAEYCRERFGFSDSRGRQLIAAAKTVTDVTLRGLPAPQTEGEARATARRMRAEMAPDEGPQSRSGSGLGNGAAVPEKTVTAITPSEPEAAARKKVWHKLLSLEEVCDDLAGLNTGRALAAADDKDLARWLRITDEAAATIGALGQRLRQPRNA
jgi:hypothetical protein